MASTDLRILTIENLRGSMAELTLRFRPDVKLTVIYGENGSGKTTICDAIEFLGAGIVGSLAGRGLGNRLERYWPSIGKLARDVKVSLESTSGILTATIRDGLVTVQPEGPRPRVVVLRRPQITRVVDARPADKYAEISKFVDVGPIEDAETILKELIEELDGTRNRDIAVILENQEQIARFWEAAGSPGEDTITWADGEVDRPPVDTKELLTSLTNLERAYVAVTGSHGRLDAAHAAVAIAEQALAQAETELETVTSRQGGGAADALGILEAAETYLSDDHHDSSTCPLCQSAERAAGLLGTIRARISSLREAQEALKKVDAATLGLRDANGGLVSVLTDFRRHSADLLAAAERYRQLGGVAEAVHAPPEEPVLLSAWIESTAETAAAWTSARDRIRDDSQFAATLRSTLENYQTNLAEQKRLDALIPKLTSALTVIRTERQTFTDEVLASISSRVGELYERVHPGEGGAALTMQLSRTRRASLEIGSSFGGQAVPPQAYFSQSHLDTIGICVFLALMEKDAPEQTILVLDDVLASLDEPHVERLVRLIASIASQFRHCVVTTHYRPWREKLRWGLLQDGSTELLELKRWSMAGGIQLTRTIPEIERLRADLESTNPDVQGLVSRAGVILEAVLEHITLTYECPLPRKRTTTPYTLGELLDGVSSRLRTALRVEVKATDSIGAVTYVEIALGPILDELGDVAQTRNAMGAHFTDLSFELLDDDALRFAKLALRLADAIVDSDAGWPTNSSSGSYWATRGETRRMHPYRRPS